MSSTSSASLRVTPEQLEAQTFRLRQLEAGDAAQIEADLQGIDRRLQSVWGGEARQAFNAVQGAWLGRWRTRSRDLARIAAYLGATAEAYRALEQTLIGRIAAEQDVAGAGKARLKPAPADPPPMSEAQLRRYLTDRYGASLAANYLAAWRSDPAFYWMLRSLRDGDLVRSMSNPSQYLRVAISSDGRVQFNNVEGKPTSLTGLMGQGPYFVTDAKGTLRPIPYSQIGETVGAFGYLGASGTADMVWQPVYKDTPYGPVFTGQWRGFNQTASTIKAATLGPVDVGTALFSLGSAVYSVKVALPALAAGTLSTGGTVFLGATAAVAVYGIVRAVDSAGVATIDTYVVTTQPDRFWETVPNPAEGPAGSRPPEPGPSRYENPNGRGVPGVPPGLYDNGRGFPIAGVTPEPPVTRP